MPLRTARPTLLLALAAAAALAGCTPPPAADAPGTPADGPLASSLQVEAAADSVRFVLQVTNAGDSPVALDFATAQRYDFAVLDGAREVWRWSAGRGFAQVLGSETLAPGETRGYEERWRPPAGLAGRTLTAVGTLTARSGRVERTASFRLPP